MLPAEMNPDYGRGMGIRIKTAINTSAGFTRITKRDATRVLVVVGSLFNAQTGDPNVTTVGIMEGGVFVALTSFTPGQAGVRLAIKDWGPLVQEELWCTQTNASGDVTVTEVYQA